jgi:hypothetical protein
MSTAAQIAANIANAQSSTGPRTDEGKARSAKNAVTFGLFSGDFIRPGEELGYAALKRELIELLAPADLLEDILVDEIHRATWRLRRCGEVESHLVLRLDDHEHFILDPMEAPSPASAKIQQSVDRARSQAHRLLHRCTAELRKRQTERKAAEEVEERTSAPAPTPINSAKPPETQGTRSRPAGTPRNAPCPCNSGQKYKRCCGKDAPPVLKAA